LGKLESRNDLIAGKLESWKAGKLESWKDRNDWNIWNDRNVFRTNILVEPMPVAPTGDEKLTCSTNN